MDPKTLFERALKQATAIISFVETHHYDNRTPCKEWDMKALVGHLAYEVAWVPDLVAGKTVKEVGHKYDGDLLGKNHSAAWEELASKALKVVKSADLSAIAHLSYGDVTMSHYINEIGGDLLIHSWDVAQGLLCNLTLNEELVLAMYDNTFPRAKEFTESGLFGTPISVAEDAPMQTKLLGLLGRSAETWLAV